MSLDASQSYLVAALENVLVSILSAGPIPQHVAFIMDGNRRWARLNDKHPYQGHSDGYAALRRILHICLRLNIRCVSVYAFAIDNFKRPKEEVDALMKMAEEKLLELCSKGDLLDEYGVRLNVVGRKELLPPAVQAAVRKAEERTGGNGRSVLNVCMPYSSRDEITTAVQSAVRHAGNSSLESLITEDDVDAQLMTSLAGSPPLDILVRTSGVKRLSDFMLWQCSEATQLHFTSAYWPNFGFWDLLPIILDYQRKAGVSIE